MITIPSPDLNKYIDLRLFDLNPQDIFDAAIVVAQQSLPDWEVREGQIEVVLLEAYANMVAELIYATNRLPSAVFESLLALHGVRRDFGAPPVVTLRFELNNSDGQTIPAGTQAILEPSDGSQPVTFYTDTELVVPMGSFEGEVTATGDRFTSDVNGYIVGTDLESPDSLVPVNYIKIAVTPSGGRDPESDADYFNRGVNRFERLVSTLVLPRHFQSFAMDQIDVERAFAIDNYNSDADPDNNGPVGVDAGHITVAMYGNDEMLPLTRQQEIRDLMSKQALANLVIHLINPTITPVNINVTVRALDGYDTATIVNNVNETIRTFLDPMTWDWGKVVYRNQLISVITNVEGVDFVLDMLAPSANITLPGIATLTSVGTVNVEVVYE